MDPKKIDIYRDTPIRYLGYTNEVGEAFRSIIGSKWVLSSYALAIVYVLADTADKSLNVYEVCTKEFFQYPHHNAKTDKNCVKKTAFTAADTLIWQLLASIAIPGFTINRICAGSSYLLKNAEKLPKNPRKWIVTAIGLSAIPFIIKPIDHLVDKLMDSSYRKMERYID